MNSKDFINNILRTDLKAHPFKWCFVGDKKIPLQKNGLPLSTNNQEHFINFNELMTCSRTFKGVGFSVNFSNITAIDVDKCFAEPFNISSINEIGAKMLIMFNNHYCEFSYSGTGLRIIFFNDNKIDNYTNTYYIKNQKLQLEMYMQDFKARYVTITGCYIFNEPIKQINNDLLFEFLNTYMLKPILPKKEVKHEDKDYEQCKKELKKHLIANDKLITKWTDNALGSFRGESERDFYLILYIYEHITTDPLIIKTLIEQSPYWISKDKKHKHKWEKTNYFNNTYLKVSLKFN